MKIHNLMEDIVREKTEEIFSDKDLVKTNNFCDCQQCLSDVICYVLNRIKPIYIFSARGVAHFKKNYMENLQRDADLVTLIHSGIEQIAKVKRPYCSKPDITLPGQDGPHFNFPVICGKMFNSETLEPIEELSLSLTLKGEIAKIVNCNWPNPYKISKSTTGIYSFFTSPEKAEAPGEKRIFEFELMVDDARYESYRHYIKLELEAEKYYIDYFRLNHKHTVEDLYLNPVSAD